MQKIESTDIPNLSKRVTKSHVFSIIIAYLPDKSKLALQAANHSCMVIVERVMRPVPVHRHPIYSFLNQMGELVKQRPHPIQQIFANIGMPFIVKRLGERQHDEFQLITTDASVCLL